MKLRVYVLTPLKGIVLGAWLATSVVAACFGSYQLGHRDGITHVVDTCNTYKKYAMDGTRELLCSAIIEPSALAPALTEELYSKENKDRNRKNRK